MSELTCLRCGRGLRRLGVARRKGVIVYSPYVVQHYVTHDGRRTCVECGVLPRSVTKLVIGGRGYTESQEWVSQSAQGGLF